MNQLLMLLTDCFNSKIGKIGPKKPLPDNVIITEPKQEEEVTKPYSDVKGVRPLDPSQTVPLQPLPQ